MYLLQAVTIQLACNAVQLRSSAFGSDDPGERCDLGVQSPPGSDRLPSTRAASKSARHAMAEPQEAPLGEQRGRARTPCDEARRATPRNARTALPLQQRTRTQCTAGEWRSPITSELIVSKTLGLGGPSLLPDGTVTWLEVRPAEGGRNVVVARCTGRCFRDPHCRMPFCGAVGWQLAA